MKKFLVVLLIALIGTTCVFAQEVSTVSTASDDLFALVDGTEVTALEAVNVEGGVRTRRSEPDRDLSQQELLDHVDAVAEYKSQKAERKRKDDRNSNAHMACMETGAVGAVGGAVGAGWGGVTIPVGAAIGFVGGYVGQAGVIIVDVLKTGM